jgi:DNA-binding NtrC family response regulator
MKPEIIQILLVEDNPGDMRLLKEYLNEASARSLDTYKTVFEFAGADRLDRAREWIQSNRADAVLLDLSLPDSHGLETFDRFHAIAPHMPIIVLSGLNDGTVAIDAVRKGAQDYLVKGEVSASLLLRSIRYAIERKRNEEEALKAGLRASGSGSAGGEAFSSFEEQMRASMASVRWNISRCIEGDAGEMNENQVRMLRQALDAVEEMNKHCQEAGRAGKARPV